MNEGNLLLKNFALFTHVRIFREKMNLNVLLYDHLIREELASWKKCVFDKNKSLSIFMSVMKDLALHFALQEAWLFVWLIFLNNLSFFLTSPATVHILPKCTKKKSSRHKENTSKNNISNYTLILSYLFVVFFSRIYLHFQLLD